MGKNMFSILSVFQGFLAAYFRVKLRFKIFIYPVLIIYSTLNEPNMVGYWWETDKVLKIIFATIPNVWKKIILDTLSIFYQYPTILGIFKAEKMIKTGQINIQISILH